MKIYIELLLWAAKLPITITESSDLQIELGGEKG